MEQHAYAELSHDYVYKSEKNVDYKIKRNLYKGMALNETTDELFSRVYGLIEKENEDYDILMKKLTELFPFNSYNEKLNMDIYENIKPLLDHHHIDENVIAEFIQQYIIDNVSDRQDIILFKQPMVLALYYLVKKYSREFREIWALPFEMLNMIYWDLGISDEQ